MGHTSHLRYNSIQKTHLRKASYHYTKMLIKIIKFIIFLKIEWSFIHQYLSLEKNINKFLQYIFYICY